MHSNSEFRTTGLKSGVEETSVWTRLMCPRGCSQHTKEPGSCDDPGWERSDWPAVTSQETLCWKTSRDLVCLQETEQYLSRDAQKTFIYFTLQPEICENTQIQFKPADLNLNCVHCNSADVDSGFLLLIKSSGGQHDLLCVVEEWNEQQSLLNHFRWHQRSQSGHVFVLNNKMSPVLEPADHSWWHQPSIFNLKRRALEHLCFTDFSTRTHIYNLMKLDHVVCSGFPSDVLQLQ